MPRSLVVKSKTRLTFKRSGDDWQAISRFAGSDIAIMREFENRFGNIERLNLETTFRCADRIAEVATKFILCNSAQIRKEVRAIRKAPGPSVHIGIPGKKASLLREVLDEIAADADKHDGRSTVLLLGRYGHTRPKSMSDLARRYRGLRFSSMTVHGSKGLEADYVVVLGLCSGSYGFPTEITDDPLLDLVLSVSERHPNAEERRLFYVALTCAKRRVFLVADGGPPSPFDKELIDNGYDVTVFGQPPESDVPCPKCRNGHLKRRESTRKETPFYDCSNYPYCDYLQLSCPLCNTGLVFKTAGAFRCRDCGKDIGSCPNCEGWLRSIPGKHGRFLGCSNYPDCKYTRDIRKKRPGGKAAASAPGLGRRKR